MSHPRAGLMALPEVAAGTASAARLYEAFIQAEAPRSQHATASSGAPDVSVCIANWNCRDLLRDCLESLHQEAQGLQLEIIVVDNGSCDGAAEMVAQEFPHVILVRNSSNLGFARANNQAARRARGRYLFFLNNDTVVPPETLNCLVDYADDHPEVGMVGPRLRDARGRLQVSYRPRPTVAAMLHRTTLLRCTRLLRGTYLRFRRDFDADTTRRVDVLMGAAMLLPRQIFFGCGGWDEDFTFGGEDLDLCDRVSRQHPIVYHPQAEIIHYGRVSSRQHSGYASTHIAIGFLRYLRKSGASRPALLLYKTIVMLDAPVHLMGKTVQFLWRSAWGRKDKAAKTLSVMRGLGHFLAKGLVAFWKA
ncbi:MAG TPA: glycosyltransferase family 2 protein [Gemmataceae bacterium]|nr:glycosyltransferase family 2 protein [Gemmataceae bacterium]